MMTFSNYYTYVTFGRGKDKQQRKRRSDALNSVGTTALVSGGVYGAIPTTVGAKALYKDIKLKRNKDKIYKTADKKNWKDQMKKNHPDLTTDPKEKIKREQASTRINNEYEKAKLQKAELDDWNKKGWKDKLKSSSDDFYDDLVVLENKVAKGVNLRDQLKNPIYQKNTRAAKDNLIKGLKKSAKLGVGLGVAGAGVLAVNKYMNRKKKKK